jgi:hypothetical protein
MARKGFYAEFDGIPYNIEIESVSFGVGLGISMEVRLVAPVLLF